MEYPCVEVPWKQYSPWRSHGSPMGTLYVVRWVSSHGSLMENPWKSHESPTRTLKPHGPMGLPWGLHRGNLGVRWEPHGGPHGSPMGTLEYHSASAVLPRDLRWTSTEVLPWKSHGACEKDVWPYYVELQLLRHHPHTRAPASIYYVLLLATLRFVLAGSDRQVRHKYLYYN